MSTLPSLDQFLQEIAAPAAAVTSLLTAPMIPVIDSTTGYLPMASQP